jgi:cytochrome c6
MKGNAENSLYLEFMKITTLKVKLVLGLNQGEFMGKFWLQKWLMAAIAGVIIIFQLTTFPSIALAQPNGEALFESNCASCHLNGGNIIRRGKNLKAKAMNKYGYTSPDAIAEIITNGKGNMSAFKDQLTAIEISTLAHYVHERSQANWQ